ncbi:MAG TPA: ParB/RepB/Spo0J family partition protein [Thermoanaerobaculia bacterium]|nr:ParB/RepB/Spo0J family partition protein [Thermoanaerobaculia bacterium]
MQSRKRSSTKSKNETVPRDFPRRGDSHAPNYISPADIRPNPKNPRLDFPQKRIESLAESLHTIGMLVPLTVYEDPTPGGPRYVLLDGERRLRAAILNNMESVPAWVVEKPRSNADNTLRMFNIHLMRDEWGDMATAFALKHVMEETGETDDKVLSRMTGLGRDTVRNMKRVLAFPEKWQQRVLEDKVPFNLLVELDKAILSKSRDPKKAFALPRLSEKQLRDFFLRAYDKRVVTDVVDLRKVGALIDTAASPESSERVRQRAQHALERLIESGASIEDAYQYGAAASTEIKQILRDVDNLPGRLNDVLLADVDDEDIVRLRTALTRLRSAVGDVLKRLG